MLSLIKRLNIDLVKEIYHYNHYSKLEMEWFRFEHEQKYNNVMISLDHCFLYPKLKKLWMKHMIEQIIEELPGDDPWPI